VINRRTTGSASLGALEINYDTNPLENSWQDMFFLLDNCQPYQCPVKTD